MFLCTGQFKKHGLAFSAENAHFGSKMEMKIPWEWTWEKYPEKSRKVEIKMQSASDFFPLGQNWEVGYGLWRRHECWRKVGRKNLENIVFFFFGRFCFRNGLGTSGRA